MMLSPSAARMGTVKTTLRHIGKRGGTDPPLGVSSRLSGKVWLSSSSLSSNNGSSIIKSFSTMIGKAAAAAASTPTTTRAITTTFLTNTCTPNAALDSNTNRWKSTMASVMESDDEDEITINVSENIKNEGSKMATFENGHVKAARARMVDQQKNNTSSSLSLDESWRINLGRGSNNMWLTGPRNEDEWFTGLKPTDCPGVDSKGKIRSLPLPRLDAVTREAAKDYFDNSWTLYETLFAGLKGEEYFYRPPPHGLRHPQIFYYGHTACLYINKLRVSGVLDRPVNAYFESIFEVGVDEMLWDDMHKNDMLWPTVQEVHEYRQQVYEVVRDAILNHPSLDDSDSPVRVDQSHPMWALFMGYEHERIHFETSSVLFREAPVHLVQEPKNWPPLHPSAYNNRNSPSSNPVLGVHYPPNTMIGVNQETVDLGKPADFPSYGWDNEYGERSMDVPNFQASEHMITNGEYYQFVKDGGYRTKDYWSDDGWAWRTHRNLKWPYFWEQVGPAGSHEYNLRTIFNIVDMPWDWPVDVTYYEAKAFCNWKTKTDGSPTSRPYRLLTEAEHHVIRHQDHNLVAARNDVNADKVMVTSGEDFPLGSTGSNLNLAFSSQNPVDYFAPSHTGHRDTTGNAWEWTEDHFNPLPGFEVHHVYDDFSSPCFDGKHSIIVGGSFMSTGDEASVFARFHFRPHFLQHSGFRLVASDDEAPATHLFAGAFDGQVAARDAAMISNTAVSPPSSNGPSNSSSNDNTATTTNVYETDSSLHMYLGLHYPYSGEREGIPSILPHNDAPIHGTNFPQRVANLLTQLNPVRTTDSALDIGCAVGGASFALAKSFPRVDAFDFSGNFIAAAKQMQEGRPTYFNIPIEADIYEPVRAVLGPDMTPDILKRVNFFTGDACKLQELPIEMGTSYDGVIMSNLLCRLPDPIGCLNGLNPIVNHGGVVVLVTPFSWLTEFTPRGKWLGGFYDPVSKTPIVSKHVLQSLMEDRGFVKIHEEEMPLLIREHARKYQYIVSEATGWRKVE